jgi:hypothetical protein
MAGGMNKRGGGIPMSQRVAGSRDEADNCPARHCWVSGSVDDLGAKRPGLLVEWRHTDADEWEGRVIYVAKLRAGNTWTVVEEWLSAVLLTER